MFRPQTLADVAQRVRDAPAELHAALNEFADEFYLDHPDKRAQQSASTQSRSQWASR